MRDPVGDRSVKIESEPQLASAPDNRAPSFDEAFRDRLTALFRWRRDVRRFKPDPIEDRVLERLIATACLAPSVGLSQPWRFVIVDDPARIAAVTEVFVEANREALAACAPADAGLYARLKLAGLREAPRQLAVFADESPSLGRGLGRRTMPETARYSVVGAITLLWLAARAEGLGLGWVSILQPEKLPATLGTPPDWTLIGYFCLGYPEAEDDTPELEREGWEHRREPGEFILRR
jgi:5,6-dimethylbenzimidazole synthase